MLNIVLSVYHQFPVIITRSNNIYGPRQYTEKVQRLIKHLIIKFFSCEQVDHLLDLSGHPEVSHTLANEQEMVRVL